MTFVQVDQLQQIVTKMYEARCSNIKETKVKQEVQVNLTGSCENANRGHTAWWFSCENEHGDEHTPVAGDGVGSKASLDEGAEVIKKIERVWDEMLKSDAWIYSR